MTATFPTESTSFFTGLTREWTHTFVWEAPVFTINAANQKRWAWIEARREFRDAFELMARGCEPLAWCDVTVEHLCATRRLADTVACAVSYKAALDGIVRAGVLPGDGPDVVRDVTFRPPTCVGVDGLVVSLVGPPALEVAS